MKLLFGTLLSAAVLLAQTQVTISPTPPVAAYTVITHFTGANPDYACKANASQNPPLTISAVTGITNANPGVATTTAAHGIYLNGTASPKIVVYITGATSGWATLNGLHVITAASTTTFNLDIDTTSFGSFSGQTVVVQTRAPLTTAKVWSVSAALFDASGNQVYSGWSANSAPSPLFGNIADLHGGTTGAWTTCTAPGAFQ